MVSTPQSETRLTSSHSLGHRHVHPRADVIDYVTDYVTVTVPEVIVWVDDQGRTVSIETHTAAGIAASTPAPVPAPSISAFSATVSPSSRIDSPVGPSTIPASFSAPQPSTPTEPPTTTSLAPAPPPAAKVAPSSAPPAAWSSDGSAPTEGPLATPASQPTSPPSEPAQLAPEPSGTQGAANQAQGSGAGFGITWSPYTSDGGCKSQDQANADFAQLAGAGFSTVRIYGVDCNQVAMTIAAVSQYNMAIFTGLVDLDDLADNLASMITQVGSNWHMIDTVSIGNELVNNGLDPGVVVAAITTARPILNAAGHSRHIVTVDVFDQLIAHPELCTASDYCAANCHAYFDNLITAEQAGNYVSESSSAIAQANPGKEVRITESGWPWSGPANGAAVPSPANQQTAMASLKAAFASNPGSLMLFDSYDAMWKQPGPFGVEQCFGIYGH
jgi:exo-beta-1,3-glucanase (GH17 family)